VAATFGSWHAAMRVAGLIDRAARRVPTASNAAARDQRQAAKREIVLAAVRRFEAEHGRLPRAMEFFKWRFVAAPDAPSQGSVYRVFPGGWEEVLTAARADIVSSDA
jgi:hypothetical protein